MIIFLYHHLLERNRILILKETIFISEGGILDDFVVMVAYSSLGFTIFCENLNRALNSRLKACRKVAFVLKKLKELKIEDIVIIS